MTTLEATEILKTDMGCYECTFGCSTPYECANGGCPFREAIHLAVERLNIDILPIMIKTEQTESLEQFRVDLEYHTDATHFGKAKGESTTTDTADTPQTDYLVKTSQKSRDSHEVDTPQTETHDLRTNTHACVSDAPRTDCETCKWGEWYRNGRDITTMDDECGGCCSWNNKWTPKEPQTDCPWK